MTRLMVVADVHIESGANYGRSPGDRLRDQANIWETACKEAVDRGVDGVLVAGDLFDRPKPSPAGYLAAYRGLRWLHAAKIPVVIIPGNHDIDGANDSAHALDVLAPFATISKRPEVVEVAGVRVATLPWASRARMAALLDGSDVDAPSATVSERLVEVAAGLRASADVLLLHWSLSGAVSSSGQSTDEFREVVLPTRELEAQDWHYVVAGHIHSRQRLDENGTIFYPGSLCVTDFSESDQPHGFAILDIEPDSGGMNFCEFVGVEQRRFVTLDLLNMIGDGDANLNVFADVENAVVRVRYTCSEEQRRRIDHREIEQQLYNLGAHRVYSIEATVQREVRARVKQATLDVEPAEALEQWIEYQAIEPPRAEKMRVEAAGYSA